MEDSKSGTSGLTYTKKVGVEWPHPQEASQQHDEAVFDLEPTGEDKEVKAQEHTAQRHQGRNAEKRQFVCRRVCINPERILILCDL